MFANILKTWRLPLIPSRNLFCTQKGKKNCKLGNISSNEYLGLRPIRRCGKEEIELIDEAYKKLVNEGLLTTEDSEINWYSVYMNKDLTVPKNDFWIRFHNTIQKIFYETERKEEKMFSYGFLVNPVNSQKDQFYHFDYAGKTGSLFISMVYHTTENSTQYLSDFVPESKPDLGPRNYNCYGYSDIELLEKEDADFLEVSQIICRPYIIMKGGKRTIHRGIKNRTKTARPVFYMNFGSHEYTVNEPARHSFEDQNKWRA